MATAVEWALAELPSCPRIPEDRGKNDTGIYIQRKGRRRRKRRRGRISSKEGGSSAGARRVECAACFRFVPEVSLRYHQLNQCAGRIVTCRFDGCMARFPLSDRAEHEEKWCKSKRIRNVLLRKQAKESERTDACPLGCGHQINSRKMKQHVIECSHRIVECTDCGTKVRYFELASHRKTSCALARRREELLRNRQSGEMLVTCEKCGQEDVLRKNMEEHLKTECAFRPVPCRYAAQGICAAIVPFCRREEHERNECPHVRRRERLIRSYRAREQNGECPLCHIVVGIGSHATLKRAIEQHVHCACPRRRVTCPNFGCDEEMFPQDVGFHTLSAGTYPCFLCDRTDMEKPYIYRSKDALTSVKIDPQKGTVPSNTNEQLKLLCELLQKHPNLRKRIVRTFQRDYADIYELKEVAELLNIEDFRSMTDEKWSALIDDVSSVAEKLKICALAGGRGPVVNKILYVCSRCFESGSYPPLTESVQYDCLKVCRVAFRRQFLLNRKSQMDRCVPCTNQGCTRKVKRRHLKRHLERECAFRKVKCARRGCGAVFLASERAKHDRECAVRNKLDVMAMMARDRFEQRACTFKCGFCGSAKRVEEHESDECPKRTVQCPNAGCETYLPAEEIAAHELVCQSKSATRLRSMEVNSWTRTLNTHKDLVDYWKLKVESRKQRVRTLPEANDALDVLCEELGRVPV